VLWESFEKAEMLLEATQGEIYQVIEMASFL
jgi:hypothetical protein